jgi:hypothetical protein
MSGTSLSRLELKWASAIFGALFYAPVAAEGETRVSPAELAAFFEDVGVHLPLRSSLGLRVAVWVVALSPLVVLGRPCTFAGLDAERREQVLSMLLASPLYVIRQTVTALKAVGALLYASPALIRSRQRVVASDRIAAARLPALVPLASLRRRREGDGGAGAGGQHEAA